MANYNYITMDDILMALENAAIYVDTPQNIKSTRGNVVTIEWQTWRSNDGKYKSALSIDFENGHALCNVTADNRIEIVYDIIVHLNCNLNVSNEYKRPYRDIIYANNPKSQFYGHIIDMTNGNIIL